ncbi:YggS family pyridoxal phosphate-dependent enzyme [Tumidithrix elongata RA019]|uniref:Pyridoxal phosphate homeostasis protein n=1 Tax=Tumidithrix elongata BACA0141 TaxID=2716417 RepID=A0AAW9Q6K7_9CYAN|nr:YggS family pyridoxal phosphate-dependent enzyme [Tumidithrix elongata RA019]
MQNIENPATEKIIDAELSDRIASRLNALRETLPPSVKLVAVSKYTSVAAMRAAYAAGIRDFGESRIQEISQKQQELQDLPDITWHMIGHLQSNKVKQALSICDWIHSIDRLSLAQQCDRFIPELKRSPKLCLQVKLAHDPDKFGWEVEQLLADLPTLLQCQNLNLVGLMTILPLGLDETQAYQVFQDTAKLAEKLRSLGWTNITELSMGMSGDYAIAVKAGATLVRVGSRIFS